MLQVPRCHVIISFTKPYHLLVIDRRQRLGLLSKLKEICRVSLPSFIAKLKLTLNFAQCNSDESLFVVKYLWEIVTYFNRACLFFQANFRAKSLASS